MRFPLRVAEAVRVRVPHCLPVFARISATDWFDGGWDIEQSAEFCKRLNELGIDLIDVSSGGHAANRPYSHGEGLPSSFSAPHSRKGEDQDHGRWA
jgi:2,4-dienoyl-CoA reductase-like NADH-dependent reductase (Old Yellow Enzyme family)